MLVYQATKSEFMDDVDRDLIADHNTTSALPRGLIGVSKATSEALKVFFVLPRLALRTAHLVLDLEEVAQEALLRQQVLEAMLEEGRQDSHQREANTTSTSEYPLQPILCRLP
jgi:hypothetical protein